MMKLLNNPFKKEPQTPPKQPPSRGSLDRETATPQTGSTMNDKHPETMRRELSNSSNHEMEGYQEVRR